MCTLEFQTRQAPDASYHWLLHALDMYHPFTWEYSRCAISANVLSKRTPDGSQTGAHTLRQCNRERIGNIVTRT